MRRRALRGRDSGRTALCREAWDPAMLSNNSTRKNCCNGTDMWTWSVRRPSNQGTDSLPEPPRGMTWGREGEGKKVRG
jgi:hypothetical protein